MDNVNKLELLKQACNNFANENGLDLDSVGIILS